MQNFQEANGMHRKKLRHIAHYIAIEKLMKQCLVVGIFGASLAEWDSMLGNSYVNKDGYDEEVGEEVDNKKKENNDEKQEEEDNDELVNFFEQAQGNVPHIINGLTKIVVNNNDLTATTDTGANGIAPLTHEGSGGRLSHASFMTHCPASQKVLRNKSKNSSNKQRGSLSKSIDSLASSLHIEGNGINSQMLGMLSMQLQQQAQSQMQYQ